MIGEYYYIDCRDYGEPMEAIYDPKIRHTCTPCGGKALADSKDDLNRMRESRKQKHKEIKHG